MCPTKGWKEICGTLTGTIRKNGEIRTGTKADSVIVEKGRAVVVRAGKERIEAENVVINLPGIRNGLPGGGLLEGAGRRRRRGPRVGPRVLQRDLRPGGE